MIIFAYIEFPLSVVTIVDEALAEKFPIYESGHWGVAKYKVTALQVLFFVEYICILRPLLIGLQKQDSCGVFVRPRAAAPFALLCSVALVFIAAGSFVVARNFAAMGFIGVFLIEFEFFIGVFLIEFEFFISADIDFEFFSASISFGQGQGQGQVCTEEAG